MADLRQLALEYVLGDDEAKLTIIAKDTARELESAPANTNPVARWVEAVQPWMPNRDGDDETHGAPDWTARAKALEFLSRTLEYLGNDVLKPSQTKLLVAFFGAMFDVDHKAGILASASALRKITEMKAFQPSSAIDIFEKLCCLKDDFPRQLSTTRLAVYKLIQSLLTSEPVEKDIKGKQGPNYQFLLDLLQLCRSERDPDCLMVWFAILTTIMTKYAPSQETLDEVYGTFKAYYPITLPRTAQSKVTPDDLKSQLRACFSCNSSLAKHTFPFLVGKLDQGDGVTVNVKIDVLRTIKACIEEYDKPDETVIPYADRIWGSLKYEVRNGEIEDVIWATLEVLKTLTTRLKENDLRDYILNVTRDCVGDLSSAMYAGAAGRLLVSVLSASPVAFVQMAAPTVTHIKESLRHPKSITHSQDLYKIIRVVLQTRILLMELHTDTATQKDFAAVDSVFKSLYHDIFSSALARGSKDGPSEEDIKVATAAVHGAGALVCQRAAIAPGEETNDPLSLLPEKTCSEICEALFQIPLHHYTTHSSEAGVDELINETTEALQKAVVAHPAAFATTVSKFQSLLKSTQGSSTETTVDLIEGLGPLLAYVGCSELPKNVGYGVFQFLSLSGLFTRELSQSVAAGTSPKIWCALMAGLENTIKYYGDALTKTDVDREAAFNGQESNTFDADAISSKITSSYGSLLGLGASGSVEYGDLKSTLPITSAGAHQTYIEVGYALLKHFFSSVTTGTQTLTLSAEFNGKDTASEQQYLHMLGDLASSFIHELSEVQQVDLKIHERSLDLFQTTVKLPVGDAMAVDETWEWLVNTPVNALFYGMIESTRPEVITKIFQMGVGQKLIQAGVSPSSSFANATTSSISKSVLSILANKHKLDGEDDLLTSIESIVTTGLTQTTTHASERIVSSLAVAAGFLRRYTGAKTKPLVAAIREVPKNAELGFSLARRLEIIVAPQRFLSKDNYATVRPLWLQKLYFDLVKPLLVGATDREATPLSRASCGIAVLVTMKHIPFSIYEEDIDQILRVAISTSQTLGTGPDTLAALTVIKSILAESPDKVQDHIRSLITICTSSFSTTATHTSPEWLPATAQSARASPAVVAQSGKLALEILAGLPRLFESRHLLSYVGDVDRQLSIACGHRVREVRMSARTARTAWSEVN
ncbi:hypothetical protein VHEMI05960 [[Torrubiella] hemipterigena]|uniref:MMS19 nucleotide excision repair protein n=1 Tax=[Torrubiella] hemipterigena TaxID=1531966 RepID=A0A0A1T5U6_9HYPO|nr:hypothetical protein VHEMI05960 [[Torrubiella] hemipterigena]